jgi:pimeloyl-ACP methyl ester carboxylesterase
MDTLFRNSRRKLSQGLLFWREAGVGTPIVFLHGAWNDSSQWVSVIESLSPDFHCFAPDLLGFGESENSQIHQSINLQSECLIEFLNALKLEKIYLVGHSIGAWIATNYALKYPEQVCGLVLLAPEGVEITGQKQYWQKMNRLVNCSPIITQFIRLIKPFMRYFMPEEQITQDLELRKILLRNPAGCQLLFQRNYSEIVAEFLQNDMYILAPPVLILQGGQDTPAALAKSNIYAQLIGQANLKIIPHGDNKLAELASKLVAEEIRDFIQEIICNP